MRLVIHHQRRIVSATAIAIAAAASWLVFAAESLSHGQVEALIKRQSQEFSDASARGDGAVLDRYLDDRVVFMGEDGSLGSKKDIVASAGPSPPGISRTLAQTDWVFELHGPVAVTSFTDVLTEDFHGQPFGEKFRSTEVWLNEQGQWRMISSQTLALQEDPPAVTLPGKLLDEYVGSYRAGPDLSYRIARSGDELTGGLAGAQPVVIKAELHDVLFTPGQPRLRKIFQRDAGGKITGFLSRREGHDLLFQRVPRA